MRPSSHMLSDSPLVLGASHISSFSLNGLLLALLLLPLLCFTLSCDAPDEPHWDRCSYTLDSLELSMWSDETLFKIREDTWISGACVLNASNLVGDCNRAELWSGIRSDVIEIKTSSGQVLWVRRQDDLSENDGGTDTREDTGEETKSEVKIGRWIIGEPLILDFPLQPLTESPSRAHPIGAMILRVDRATYDELRGVIELYDPARETLVILGEFKLTRIS